MFYLVYRTALRRDTYFTLHRYVLLVLLIISAVYPLLDIAAWIGQHHVLKEVTEAYMPYFLEHTIAPYLPGNTVIAASQTTHPFTWSHILLGVYWVATSFFFVRLACHLTKIVSLRLRCKPITLGTQRVYSLPNQAGPFSFFNWLFIYPDNHPPEETQEIITHELVHIRQGHTFDILLSELVCVLCWFNPFVWLFKKEIQRNHEFIVDSRVIKSGINSQSYQFHLLRLANYPLDCSNRIVRGTRCALSGGRRH